MNMIMIFGIILAIGSSIFIACLIIYAFYLMISNWLYIRKQTPKRRKQIQEMMWIAETRDYDFEYKVGKIVDKKLKELTGEPIEHETGHVWPPF